MNELKDQPKFSIGQEVWVAGEPVTDVYRVKRICKRIDEKGEFVYFVQPDNEPKWKGTLARESSLNLI